MIKKMLLMAILFQTCGSYAGDLATDSTATSTICAVYGTQIVVNGIDCLLTGTDCIFTCTDLVGTPTQFGFIQAMNADLQAFISSLSADRQLFQAWNVTITQLNSSMSTYEQQHAQAIDQLRATINQLQQLLATQERQGQEYATAVNALYEQLAALQSQTDQEIIALQQQLDNTTLELDTLEDEYGDFIDASFAHVQGFYNMLQLAKQEYTAMITERTQFFNSLQVLTDALLNNAQGMNSEVYDLIQAFNASQA